MRIHERNIYKMIIIILSYTDLFTKLYSLRLNIGMVSDKTKNIFQKIQSRRDGDSFSAGAGSSSTLKSLEQLDSAWGNLKNGGWKEAAKTIVFPNENEFLGFGKTKSHDFDIIVAGGTLGIFYAMVMQSKGFKTCIVEKARVVGRDQEWNISKKELKVLIKLCVLTQEEVDEVIRVEFNPVRVGFHSNRNADGFELLTRDILNVGVNPRMLINLLKSKYLNLGGFVYENVVLTHVNTYRDAAVINILKEDDNMALSCRLLIDAMGNASPIVRQIRSGQEPDGICIVVGTCARGFNPSNNTYGDVIYTNDIITTKSLNSKHQYFWEAFPAGSNPTDRTTYLFTYIDAKSERPSVSDIFDDYWDLLPAYQGVNIEDLEWIRILHGVFPTYRNSPIQSPFSRIFQVGDASGIQSPLSFGGFGSLTRHLERITTAIDEATRCDLLEFKHLNLINGYQPNLSAAWMFQKSMSVPIGSKPDPKLIVSILSNSFSSMESLGDATIRPFLQDVIQFNPLFSTLFNSALQDILTPIKIIPHVGILAILDFVYHMFAMWYFTFLSHNISPFYTKKLNDPMISNEEKFRIRCLINQWKFGSGLDYSDHE